LLFLIKLRLEQATGLGPWVGYGLLWGITALSDPAVLSLLPLLRAWVCYRLRKRRQRSALRAGIAVVALVVVATPWFVRNYRTLHQFIPFRDAFWLVMHVGNNGDTSHWAPDAAHPSTSAEEEQEYNRLGELNYMAEKRREAIAFIRSNPNWYLRITFRWFVFTWTGFWSLSREYLAMEPTDPGNIVMSTLLTFFAVAGLRRAFQEAGPAAVPYALVLIVFPLIYYISIPQMSYRHPIDPEIVVLASYGAIGWAHRWRKIKLAKGDKPAPAQHINSSTCSVVGAAQGSGLIRAAALR
jgi:hypothetical protein